MNKNSKILIFLSIITVVISTIALLLVYQKEDTLTFTARIKEVYPSSVILTPLDDETVAFSDYSADITGVSIGDIVKITCKKEIKETYPAIIEVIKHEIIIQ